MSEEKKKEWAIRDEATGEWWGHQYPVTGLGWGSTITRHASYLDARNSPAWAASFLRETARIVPAPPREMSDAECWEWLHERGMQTNWIVRANYGDAGVWYCGGNTRDLAIWTEYHGYGATPYDAIRAARRKLEVGK